jgi:hypothetical protein
MKRAEEVGHRPVGAHRLLWEDVVTGGSTMRSRSVLSITTLLVLLVAAACGSDPATTSPSSDTRQTTPSTSTKATTTTSSSTTTTTTTAPAPPTEPPVTSAGWSNVAPESLSSKAFPPCCADTWHGEVSPPLAAEGEPLADGPYAVDLEWPQDLTQPLELELFRFEQCELLPEFACEGSLGEFVPDQLGIDTSASRPLKVVLDDTAEVVVVGWSDALTSDEPVIQKGTGTDLAVLAAEVETAYADVFAERFSQGESPEAIIADVLANPTADFSPSAREMNSFVFLPERGPSLLFQDLVGVFPIVDGQRTAGRGTDVLAVRSIEVVEGQVTLYVYSGYYP